MSPDLDALSREIAATSPAWLVPGVEAIAEGRLGRAIGPESDGFWLFFDGREFAVKAHFCRPNLRDPVTVNGLLGTGEARWDATKTYWIATIGKGEAACPTRTHAITRAWIAAHGEEGNG